MYKMQRALITLTLVTITFIGGSSLATMQERTNTNNQTNQNNSSQNRNSNGNRSNSNMNRNGNMNRNMNGSMTNGSMMNSNMGGSMNSNTGVMVSNMSAMNDGMMIGNISVEEFNRLNAQGSAMVAAITPTSTPLSKDDQKLMMQVAMGGMMQLEVSRAALQRVSTPQARLLAQSEVEEQTGVGAKLREIASAKGMTMPMAMDSKTRSMINKMQGMNGTEIDRFYVRESGVKGHEKLEKTMLTVQSRATDPAMKSLAMATLPVIRTHLQVSRVEVNRMSGNNRSTASMSNSNMNR